MKSDVKSGEVNYVFCIEKQNKDGFFFEAKARSLACGKFYDVRFDGKKKYVFYVFSNRRWNVYFMRRDTKYYPAVFKNANDFIRLEQDIHAGGEKPVKLVSGAERKIKNLRLRGGAKIYLPEFPFLYDSELKTLDFDLQKERYKYQTAPKYLITARKAKYVKPDSADSVYLYGCNSDELYKRIIPGSAICVTHTYENEKAVAVSKIPNRYNVIPIQHCLRTL